MMIALLLLLLLMMMMIRLGGIVDVTILRFATHGRDARRDVDARRLLRPPRGRHRRGAHCARDERVANRARASRLFVSLFSYRR